MKLRRMGMILCLLQPLFLPISTQAFDFQGCVDCHQEPLERDAELEYSHSPFAAGQCGGCHTAQDTGAFPAPQKAPASPLEPRQKVNWLGDSVTADTSHGFLLPSNKLGENLIVDLQGTDGRFSRQEIAVPLLVALGEVEDSGKPPVISDVQVLEVKRGVFLSATIGWQTDTLTDTLVRYGEQDLNQTSESGARVGRKHQAMLYKLEVDRTYRFSVVSTDLFGRSQISEPLTFSTSKPITAKQPGNTGNLPDSGGIATGLASSFQRLGADYLLEVTLAQPASVFIGSKGTARKQSVAEAGASAKPGESEAHAGLSGKEVVTMGACLNCHQSKDTATHPVNVYAKPGMTIPPEYPTLPDGRITCNSCHSLHASENEFLLRKPGKRELCIGCHKDML